LRGPSPCEKIGDGVDAKAPQTRQVEQALGRWLSVIGRHFDLVSLVLIGIVMLYAVVRASYDEGFHLSRGSVSNQVRDVLWFSTLCGLASFTTIEAVKRLTSVRARYHSWQTRIWLEARMKRISPSAEPVESPFVQLLRAMGLAEGRRSSLSPRLRSPEWLTEALDTRIFGLPTEQLMAQISAAADLALSTDESRYQVLIPSLTADASDLQFALRPRASKASDDRGEAEQSRRVLQLRMGIDQLQVALASRWKRYLCGAALALSGLFGIGLTYAGREPAGDEPRNVLAALLIGGVIAMVARDLTAIAERLRG
jgi:hypothetical protein